MISFQPRDSPTARRGGGVYASCDPSQWPDDMDLSVDIVGIGNREQALEHLSLIGGLHATFDGAPICKSPSSYAGHLAISASMLATFT